MLVVRRVNAPRCSSTARAAVVVANIGCRRPIDDMIATVTKRTAREIG
ncbi:MAG: hypothetical protein QOG42_339 [Solirubrobacteraceae bacterium]|nr:hypothetical protein [Solirubrobacteraceae bacterium]